MKKLGMILFAFTLLFASVGSVLLVNDTEVEAKSYKSGKKGFSPNKSNFQKDKNTDSSSVNKNTKDKSTTANKGGFSSGGFMRGLFVGGLAGMLFGSLFSDLGLLGNLLGFMINAGAILLVLYLALKIYYAMKRKNEASNQWRH